MKPAVRMREAVRHAGGIARDAILAVWRGAVEFYHSENLTFAASMAYYGLLSLFPFSLLVLSLVGTATASEGDRAALLEWVMRYFPRQFDFVTTQLDALARSRVRLGVAGFLITVWAALGVFGAITSAVNHAWGVERQPSYWKHKLVSFLMLVAAGLLFVAALALVSARGVVEASWFATVLRQSERASWLQGVASTWNTTALLVAVVGLIFYFVPNTTVRFRDVWLGAIVTGLLWQAALKGFSWYVRDLSRFSIHGSVGAVVAFLLWVYVSSVILLYGVEYTAAYARLRARRVSGVELQA